MREITLGEILTGLKTGDYERIAQHNNCSKETVRSILTERRNWDTDLGISIIAAALILSLLNKRNDTNASKLLQESNGLIV